MTEEVRCPPPPPQHSHRHARRRGRRRASPTRKFAAAFALGRPLFVAEVVGLIQSDPTAKRELELINSEIEDGMEITDVEIAIRLKMPLGFVRSFLLAIRGDTADQRPAKTN